MVNGNQKVRITAREYDHFQNRLSDEARLHGNRIDELLPLPDRCEDYTYMIRKNLVPIFEEKTIREKLGKNCRSQYSRNEPLIPDYHEIFDFDKCKLYTDGKKIYALRAMCKKTVEHIMREDMDKIVADVEAAPMVIQSFINLDIEKMIKDTKAV